MVEADAFWYILVVMAPFLMVIVRSRKSTDEDRSSNSQVMTPKLLLPLAHPPLPLPRPVRKTERHKKNNQVGSIFRTIKSPAVVQDGSQ